MTISEEKRKTIACFEEGIVGAIRKRTSANAPLLSNCNVSLFGGFS